MTHTDFIVYSMAALGIAACVHSAILIRRLHKSQDHSKWLQSQLDSAHELLLYRIQNYTIHNYDQPLTSNEIREWIATGEIKGK